MITPDLSSTPLPPGRPPANAVHNIFWLIAERALKAAGGVSIGILIARHLGPSHYGCYGAAIGLATLAKDAVVLGFDRMVRRDIAARPAEAGKIIGSSIVLGLVLAVLVGLGLSELAGHLVDDEETRRLTLIVVWMSIPQAFFACEIWFESTGRASPLVRTRNAVWTVAIVGRLILVLENAGVTAFATLALVEWVATYAAVYILLRRFTRHQIHFSLDTRQLKAWFREGWPMVVMVAVGSTADRFMVLIVHTLASTEAQAGYMNASLRITEIWWSMSTIVGAVLLPRIVALQRTNPARCAQVTQLYADASLLVGIAAAIAVSISAPFIIPRVFGPAYAPSAIVLVIAFWAGPVVFPSAARAQYWVSRGKLVLDLPTVTCTAIVQLSLALVLVPRFGAIGAAISMVTAQWVGFYGVTSCVPFMRRESVPQFAAFRSLRNPIGTFQSLYSFFAIVFKPKSAS